MLPPGIDNRLILIENRLILAAGLAHFKPTLRPIRSKACPHPRQSRQTRTSGVALR